jgi:putative ABC transport system ATP-binding protein
MIEFANIGRTYRRGDRSPVVALKDLSFRITQGEFVAVRGPSGSGKSTVLNIIGCLDTPTAGTYRLGRDAPSNLSDRARSRMRGQTIGFVFQSFNLLARTTALENVELPMIYHRGRVDRRRAIAALERVGLHDRLHHYATELSGGEQQRVAVARALINDPAVILADEPTGNLDAVAGNGVLVILQQLHNEGRTIVLVTHDDAVAARASREMVLSEGMLVSDHVVTHASRE